MQAPTRLGRAARGLTADAAQRHLRASFEARGRIRRAGRRGPTVVLEPADALRRNGFTVFRGLLPPADCARRAAELKEEARIVPGQEFTRVDATNKFAASRAVLFDERVLGAVRRAVAAPVRFLQVSDLHYLHDTAGWHRDSVHRAYDSSAAADWSDGGYGVVKAILYLESDNAALGMMCGSHLSPREMDRAVVRAVERRGGQLVIDAGAEVNRAFGPHERAVPVVWKAEAGDLLVFDERLYHAGRRVDGGRVTKDLQAAKFTLSLVFGADNLHSHRLYSYFRYARRELHYRDFAPDLLAELKARDLVLHEGLGNYYLRHPEELRLAHLRHPETMDALVAEFTHDGAALRGQPTGAGGTAIA